MAITDTQTTPAPPNVIAALRGGFDAIANRIYIILVPVLLDLWLWLGPHLQIKELMTSLFESMKTMPGFDGSQPSGLLPLDLSVYEAATERINLMTFLRSYPIGVPSLITGSLPMQAPYGDPLVMDVKSPVVILFIMLMLTLLGLLIGTFYFILIAQATVEDRVQWKKAVQEWPRSLMQVFGLSLAALLVLIVLLIPSTCILSFASMGGISVSQIGVVVLLGMMIWVIFPLIFTPHGLFASHVNLLTAVQRSMVLTRMTLPNTALLLFLIFIAGQGLDVLWRVPSENSWLTLVGLAGHAFVASGLLAASFVYYRDADRWAQTLIRKASKSAQV